MKTLLLTTCLLGALSVTSAAASFAAAITRTGEYTLSQADACQSRCRANADACRGQCSDPEEQEQCVVACDKSACKTSCNKFEEACKQRCQSSGG